MNSIYGVNDWITLSRWSAIFCCGMMLPGLAMAWFWGGIHGPFFALASLPYVCVSIAFSTMFHVFRSQQTEIEELKAAIERLENGMEQATTAQSGQAEGIAAT